MAFELFMLVCVVASVSASAGNTPWQSFSGFSACTKGGCLVNKDTSNFHYVGSFDSPSACAETCLNNSTCAIWIHSEISTHCWWRTDGIFGAHSEAKKVYCACVFFLPFSIVCVFSLPLSPSVSRLGFAPIAIHRFLFFCFIFFLHIKPSCNN